MLRLIFYNHTVIFSYTFTFSIGSQPDYHEQGPSSDGPTL